MLLKIALNGARPKEQNKSIPQTIDEIKKEVSEIYNIGYKVFHIHCFDKNGKESLKPEDVDNLILTVKNVAKDIMVGISTGDWIEPDLEKRIAYIRQWKYPPDFASVNMIDEDAIKISKELILKGVLIEAGLNEKVAAEIFVNSDIIENCCRVLIEPEEEDLAAAIKTIKEIESVLDSNNVKVKRLLHGFNSVSWHLLREAKKRGYDGRIGLEDTIYSESGKMVSGNIDLINEAMQIINTI